MKYIAAFVASITLTLAIPVHWSREQRAQLLTWQTGQQDNGASGFSIGSSEDGLEEWVFSKNKSHWPLQIMYMKTKTSLSACITLYYEVVVDGFELKRMVESHSITNVNSESYDCKCRLNRRLAPLAYQNMNEAQWTKIAKALKDHEARYPARNQGWHVSCPQGGTVKTGTDGVYCALGSVDSAKTAAEQGGSKGGAGTSSAIA